MPLNSFEKKIMSFLKDQTEDQSVATISKGVKVNRITIGKYLAILEAKGLIVSRNVGPSILYKKKRRKHGKEKN